MLVNWQEQQKAENENSQPYENLLIATVGAVYSDGLTLIFPGSDAASEKRYKYNLNGSFSAGNRVLIGRVTGSYVVICKI